MGLFNKIKNMFSNNDKLSEKIVDESKEVSSLNNVSVSNVKEEDEVVHHEERPEGCHLVLEGGLDSGHTHVDAVPERIHVTENTGPDGFLVIPAGYSHIQVHQFSDIVPHFLDAHALRVP